MRLPERLNASRLLREGWGWVKGLGEWAGWPSRFARSQGATLGRASLLRSTNARQMDVVLALSHVGISRRQTRLVHPVAKACLVFSFRASSSSLAFSFPLRRVSPFGPDRRLRLLLLEHPHSRSSSDDRNHASYGKHSQELGECNIRRGRKGVSATNARAAPKAFRGKREKETHSEEFHVRKPVG